jgi:hypothetical protein
MEPAQPNQQNQQPNPRESFFAQIPWFLWLLILVAVIAIVLLVIYFLNPTFKNRVGNLTAPQNIWTPTPIPILSGTQKYTISGGTKGLPQITSLALDPQDPVVGKTQTISVAANNATPIKEVIAILHLDNNKDFEYTLDLKEGTNTNGTWTKTITFPSAYNINYRVTVKARNGNGLGNMSTITIR